jgi:uncharacterized protein (TIGR03382 family)
MLGLAKVAAISAALLAGPVGYLAYSASQNGDNGNHYGQIKNGNNGNDKENVRGAPSPVAGAGIAGLLAAAGFVWLMRRRRRAA